ncbi:MAG: formylglycine-generating enzyme family protein [Bacteroidales bacterium]|nr:formylglycine-generating enzyme family protein [Bacteroidales bacterium]
MKVSGFCHSLATLALCVGPLFSFLLPVPGAGSALRAQDSVVTVRVADGVSVEMVHVEGGSFTMGNNDTPKGVKLTYALARPEHRVTVGSFYIGRFEVTQGLWKAVMGSNPSKFNSDDNLPVECVSWNDAQQFALMLSQMTGRRFRLPTEAEWEYAARGGARGVQRGSRGTAGNPYAGCKDRGQLQRYCWFCVNSGGSTHPVGQLAPNELGLYDLSGNVAEWCQDWVEEYPTEEQTNPRGPMQGENRVLRGGHYNSTSAACTVYDRGWYLPTGRYELFGLRLVMEVDE